MNVIVMIGMMGLMLLFFHGRGHHSPAPEPAHHATRPAVSPTAPSGFPEAVRPAVETRAVAVDEADRSAGTKPKSPPEMPVVPQAE